MALVTSPGDRSQEHGRPAASAEASPSQSQAGWRTGRRNRANPDRTKTWDGHIQHVQALANSLGFRQLRGQIITAARLTCSDHVLDVGAGTGLLTLAAAPSVAHVTAVDISPAMCRHLEREFDQRSNTNADVITASASDLPLSDASFDVVVSNYCFHHLKNRDKRRALSEAIRVLRPNGRLVIGDMMFHVGFRQARDRAVVVRFTAEMLRRGPAGVMRLAKNAVRVVTGRGEHPAGIHCGTRRWTKPGSATSRCEPCHHEGGIATARRPRIRTHTFSQPGARSSATTWTPSRWSTGSSATPSSSVSKATATASKTETSATGRSKN